jgi:hypothetical protein
MTTFTWTSPDPLNNKAVSRSIYITELQSAVNTRRTEIGLAPITFIDQRVGRKFRLDAIEELKIVTNDLAILYGYPTGVQDPALLGRPYVTITKKYGKTVCPYPILNDLRYVLDRLEAQVLLYMDYVLNFFEIPDNRNLANLYIDAYPTIKSLAKSQYSWSPSCRVCCDNQYVYRAYPSGVGDTFIYKENIQTGDNLALESIAGFQAVDMCVDANYVYVTGYSGSGYYVKRLSKIDLSGLISLITIDATGSTYSFNSGGLSIICDLNYLYISGAKKEGPIGSPYFTLYNPHGAILRYNKTGGAPTEFLYRENYVPPQPLGPNWTELSSITMDSEYLYVTYYEHNWPPSGLIVEAMRILKIRISSMALVANWVCGTAGDNSYTSLTMGGNYIYLLNRASVWAKPGDGLFTSFDKVGNILVQSNYVAGRYLRDTYVRNKMGCKDEYLAGL